MSDRRKKSHPFRNKRRVLEQGGIQTGVTLSGSEQMSKPASSSSQHPNNTQSHRSFRETLAAHTQIQQTADKVASEMSEVDKKIEALTKLRDEEREMLEKRSKLLQVETKIAELEEARARQQTSTSRPTATPEHKFGDPKPPPYSQQDRLVTGMERNMEAFSQDWQKMKKYDKEMFRLCREQIGELGAEVEYQQEQIVDLSIKQKNDTSVLNKRIAALESVVASLVATLKEKLAPAYAKNSAGTKSDVSPAPATADEESACGGMANSEDTTKLDTLSALDLAKANAPDEWMAESDRKMPSSLVPVQEETPIKNVEYEKPSLSGPKKEEPSPGGVVDSENNEPSSLSHMKKEELQQENTALLGDEIPPSSDPANEEAPQGSTVDPGTEKPSSSAPIGEQPLPKSMDDSKNEKLSSSSLTIEKEQTSHENMASPEDEIASSATSAKQDMSPESMVDSDEEPSRSVPAKDRPHESTPNSDDVPKSKSISFLSDAAKGIPSHGSVAKSENEVPHSPDRAKDEPPKLPDKMESELEDRNAFSSLPVPGKENSLHESIPKTDKNAFSSIPAKDESTEPSNENMADSNARPEPKIPSLSISAKYDASYENTVDSEYKSEAGVEDENPLSYSKIRVYFLKKYRLSSLPLVSPSGQHLTPIYSGGIPEGFNNIFPHPSFTHPPSPASSRTLSLSTYRLNAPIVEDFSMPPSMSPPMPPIAEAPLDAQYVLKVTKDDETYLCKDAYLFAGELVEPHEESDLILSYLQLQLPIVRPHEGVQQAARACLRELNAYDELNESACVTENYQGHWACVASRLGPKMIARPRWSNIHKDGATSACSVCTKKRKPCIINKDGRFIVLRLTEALRGNAEPDSKAYCILPPGVGHSTISRAFGVKNLIVKPYNKKPKGVGNSKANGNDDGAVNGMITGSGKGAGNDGVTENDIITDNKVPNEDDKVQENDTVFEDNRTTKDNKTTEADEVTRDENVAQEDKLTQYAKVTQDDKLMQNDNLAQDDKDTGDNKRDEEKITGDENVSKNELSEGDKSTVDGEISSTEKINDDKQISKDNTITGEYMATSTEKTTSEKTTTLRKRTRDRSTPTDIITKALEVNKHPRKRYHWKRYSHRKDMTYQNGPISGLENIPGQDEVTKDDQSAEKRVLSPEDTNRQLSGLIDQYNFFREMNKMGRS